MLTYFDKVKVLYPNIQRVMYWYTNPETNEPWADPYDGLFWENPDIKKPTKKQLDAVTDESADAAKEQIRKDARDATMVNDMSVLAGYKVAVDATPDLAFTDYLDQLETLKQEILTNS